MIDQFRKLKTHWFYVISLGLLIITISATYTVMKTSVDRLDQNYDAFLKTQQVEDFYFSMGDIDLNYLTGSQTITLCQELDILTDCSLALAQPHNSILQNELNILVNQKIKDAPDVYDRIVQDAITIFEDQYNYTVEKRVTKNIIDDPYIYKFISITESISIPYIHEGRLPNTTGEIAIFQVFAEANDLEIHDTLEIDGTFYTITGFFYQVDFIYPIFSLSTIEFDPNVQTLVLTTEETINHLGGFAFTKYHVKGDLVELIGDVGYDELMNADYSRLNQGMRMVQIVFPKELNYRIIALDEEVTNARVFMNTFLPVFYGLTLLIITLFITRYIKDNKADILIFKQLGYTQKEIHLGLFTLPLLLGSLSVLGYVIGLALHPYIFRLYSARYLYPKAPFQFEFTIFLFTVIIPFMFILIVSYITIHKALLFKTVTKKRFIFKFVPIKTLVYTLILFLSIGVFVHVGVLASNMFSDFIDTTKTGNHYEEMINLQYYENDPLKDSYESYTKETITITSINHNEITPKRTMLYGIDSDTSLKRLIDDDVTNNALLLEGIIISDYLSTQLALDMGDSISFTLGSVSLTKEIVGISNELIDSNIFMLKSEMLAQLGFNYDAYNGIYTTDHTYDHPYITSRIDYNASVDQMADVLTISTYILNVLLTLSVIIGLYLFILVMIEYNDTQSINIAILKSLGYTLKEIHIRYTLPLYIGFVSGFILSIPVSTYLIQQLLNVIIETIGFKLVLDINPVSFGIVFIASHFFFGVLVFIEQRRYDQISIHELLKKE